MVTTTWHQSYDSPIALFWVSSTRSASCSWLCCAPYSSYCLHHAHMDSAVTFVLVHFKWVFRPFFPNPINLRMVFAHIVFHSSICFRSHVCWSRPCGSVKTVAYCLPYSTLDYTMTGPLASITIYRVFPLVLEYSNSVQPLKHKKHVQPLNHRNCGS